MAGIFDGEGSVILQISKDSDSDRLSCNPFVKVTLHRKETWLLEEFRLKFGGTVRQRTEGRVVDWVLRSRDEIESFLKSIQKYLRLKRRQAGLMLRAIKIIKRTRSGKPRLYQDWIELAKISDEISSLNFSNHRKWSYNEILAYLEKTGLGTPERRRKLASLRKGQTPDAVSPPPPT
jgi:hypothetical protein